MAVPVKAGAGAVLVLVNGWFAGHVFVSDGSQYTAIHDVAPDLGDPAFCIVVSVAYTTVENDCNHNVVLHVSRTRSSGLLPKAASGRLRSAPRTAAA